MRKEKRKNDTMETAGRRGRGKLRGTPAGRTRETDRHGERDTPSASQHTVASGSRCSRRSRSGSSTTLGGGREGKRVEV